MYARAIPPEVFARRRRRVMEHMGPNTLALVAAAPMVPRNRDVHYPYRQDSDFYYLTGFPEPEAMAVLVPGAAQGFLLFCRDRDPQMEIWHGRRLGPRGAKEYYGADRAYPITQIDRILLPLLENRERLYYPLGEYADLDARVIGWIKQIRARGRSGVRAPTQLIALEQVLHPLRCRKEAEEVAVVREAARIAGEAHCRAMQRCRPGMMEYEIAAEFLQTFLSYGASWSYPPIVAGGENGCILHYTENRAELHDGDLLLIDAGAEVDGYASDITRTFPINGRFSGEQRALYELVLAAQQAAIKQVRPGNSFNKPHEAAVRVLTEGLVDLGLLQGEIDELIETEHYKTFYMHRTGHWLGLDVHDVGSYKVGEHWQVLEPGMILTVEPGLYIPTGAKVADPAWAQWGISLETEVETRWQGMGIRIEDDVLVTTGDPEVLTSLAPKAVDDIEALMRAG